MPRRRRGLRAIAVGRLRARDGSSQSRAAQPLRAGSRPANRRAFLRRGLACAEKVEIGRDDHGTADEGRDPLHGVLQLADIAGPRMAEEARRGIGTQSPCRPFPVPPARENARRAARCRQAARAAAAATPGRRRADNRDPRGSARPRPPAADRDASPRSPARRPAPACRRPASPPAPARRAAASPASRDPCRRSRRETMCRPPPRGRSRRDRRRRR